MYNFNQEDLVQYLYKETSPEKTAAITAALSSDYNLREIMEILSASYDKLDSIELLSPRQQTIDAILNYAEKPVEELHA
jgi:hypothetical protein